MLKSIFKRFCLTLVTLISISVMSPHAQEKNVPEKPAQTTAPISDVAKIQNELKNLSSSIAKTSTNVELIDKNKTSLETLNKQILELIPSLENQFSTLDARLKDISPNPDNKTPVVETPELLKQREALKKEVGEADSQLKLARLLTHEIGQQTEELNAQKRKLFTQQIFLKTTPLYSKDIWFDSLSEWPHLGLSFFKATQKWMLDSISNLTSIKHWLALCLIALLIFIFFKGHAFLKAKQNQSKRTLQKLAFLLPKSFLLLPAFFIISGIILENSGWLSESSLLIFSLGFLSWIIYKTWINIARLYTNHTLKIFDITSEWDTYIKSLAKTLGLCSSLLLLVPHLLSSIYITEHFHDFTTALTNITIATLILISARKYLKLLASDECLGPQVLSTNENLSKAFAYGLYGLCGATILASLSGYNNFASFALKQVVWFMFLLSIVFLIFALLDKGASEQDPDKQKLSPASILAKALLKCLVLLAAIFAISAPWGLQSGDVTSWFYKLATGIQIGSLRIAFLDLGIAIFIFSLILYITKIIKAWLEKTFLPATKIDHGLRSSLVSVTGYFGFVIAISTAFSALGIGLENIALVAGALSVGIGFGLQSIVNNFVSGLILLWERPIRIGDWVEVGSEQGYVRRINVRATEIETPEQASLIVPNSELIGGRIKNWMYSDDRARITMSFSVAFETDPERIKKIVFEEIAKNPDIVPHPEPSLFFKSFGAKSLDFELKANIRHVNRKLTVMSELHYALFERFKVENIESPTLHSEIHIKNIDELKKQMQEEQEPPKPKGKKS